MMSQIPTPPLSAQQTMRRRGNKNGRRSTSSCTLVELTTLFLWIMLVGAFLMVVIQSEMVSQFEDVGLASIIASSDFQHHRGLGAANNNAKRQYPPSLDMTPGVHVVRHVKVQQQQQHEDYAPQDAFEKYIETQKQKEKAREKMEERKRKQEVIDYAKYVERANLSKTFDFEQKDFSNYSALPSTRYLPDMTTDKGGVIFYLHVPKTGGQTIRNSFGSKLRDVHRNFSNPDLDQIMVDTHMARVRYIMANRLRVFENKAVPKINRYLSVPTRKPKLLMVEVHGMDNYDALELEPYIHAWRERSKETGVPFFAFATLREAVSEQVSFFNFYFIHPGDERFCNDTITTSSRCDSKPSDLGQYLDLTQDQVEEGKITATYHRNKGIDLEDAMIKSIYDNPQCLFLARGERTFGTNASDLREGLSQEECDATYQSLRRTMDWIGSTEKLTDETLPLLTAMMFNKSHIGRKLKKSNTSPQRDGFVSLSQIQPETREILEQSSKLDDNLYQHVVEDYRIDQWVNYQPSHLEEER